ncbi:MAG: TMEM175 family protein [Rudaea sp.]|uniref:TMEM175 family protein n=1 Tax=Rudaea sp. TaxID=2136325 RepID=UPI0039E316D4
MPSTLHDAMRIRRQQPTRLEGFVDASFAFAVTLVVIAVGHVPASVPEMMQALRGLPTFAVCFVLISRIWLTHRNWSRYYDIEDGIGMGLSLALVFIVLIFVYPMRMLFAQALMGWSGGWLSDGSVAALQSVDELRTAYTVFGVGFAAIGTVFILLYAHALRLADRIGLDAGERLFTRMRRTDWSGHVAISLLSIALARWLPFNDVLEYSIPGIVYALNVVTGAICGRHYRRQFARLRASGP